MFISACALVYSFSDSALAHAQVEISKSYGKVEWRDDLMLMLKKAGAEPCIPSVFLFSDTQITDEGFVEDINNLLNSGEVIQLHTRHFMYFLQKESRSFLMHVKLSTANFQFRGALQE